MKASLRNIVLIAAAFCAVRPGFSAAGRGEADAKQTKGTSSSTVIIGTVTGIRGTIVTVPISLDGDGKSVFFQADIEFSPGNIVLPQTNPVIPVAGATCTPTSLNTVRVSRPSSNPLPPNVRYCDIRLKIPPDAIGGIQPITVRDSICRDELGVDLACQTTPGAVNISSVQTSLSEGTSIVIAGYAGTAQETRRLRITNVGATNLDLTCGLSPATPGLTLTGPTTLTTLLPNQGSDAIITCDLPALGAPDRFTELACSTTDSVRGSLRYAVRCTTVAPGEPLPGDQLSDNQLQAGDQLGASATQSLAPASGNQIVALGAPFAGGDRSGRVVLYEGSTQVSQPVADGRGTELAMRRVGTISPRLRENVFGTLSLDKFGAAVAMTQNGQRLAIGAPGANSGIGSVKVFQRPATAGGWDDLDFDDPIPAPVEINPPPAAIIVTKEFGSQLAFIEQDGGLIVGAPASDVNGVTNAGAVFRFQANGGGFNAAPDSFTSIAPVVNGRFGEALAMGIDMLVIGAPREGASEAGAAYRFDYASGQFQPSPRIVSSSAAPAGDRFGSAIAVNGPLILIGAPGEDTLAGVGSGAVRRYRRPSPGGSVIESGILLPSSGSEQASGSSVATNGDIILVGAPNANDGQGAAQGRVYVYDVKANFAPQELPSRQLNGIGTSEGDTFGKAVSVNRQQAIVGVPLSDLEVPGAPSILDAGQGNSFLLDTVFRDRFE